MNLPFMEIPPEGEGFRDKLPRIPWDTFCNLSLFNWLEAVKKANLPYVPATEIWRGPIESLLLFDTPGPHLKDLEVYSKSVQENQKPDTMLRWDCCAGEGIKYKMASARPYWDKSLTELQIDDCRAFDMIFEYPRDEMIVWSRPWMKAVCVEGYPVEFRVFLKEGKVIGASNYYPQCSLPEEYGPIAMSAVYLTQILVPFLPMGINGTADWILTFNKGLLFLEGGPGYGQGAHPCCFEGGEINGIALKPFKPLGVE